MVVVESRRKINGEITDETRFYITSLLRLAEAVGPMIRAHWAIENSLHWIMDMVIRDAKCRVSVIDAGIADLPIGLDVILVSDQPVVVKNAIGEFMESLWQAIAIIMAVNIIGLGFRPGAVVALSIPLTVAIIFPIMEFIGIDLQRISLGALIIALGLLADDEMTTVDVMTSRMASGDSKRPLVPRQFFPASDVRSWWSI